MLPFVCHVLAKAPNSRRVFFLYFPYPCLEFLQKPKIKIKEMALKAVHVSDVPNLDQVPGNVTLNYLHSPRVCKGQFLLLIIPQVMYFQVL